MTLCPIPKPTKGPKRRTRVAPSIMQDSKECYITGALRGLHRHEVFFGTCNRAKSLEWGCWVYLRADWHTDTSYSVHKDIKLNKRLKREAQAKFEELHGHEKFMEVFGKNYLQGEGNA